MLMEIHGVNYNLDEELKRYIERRLEFALGRFQPRIERITVRMADVNGPRGGADKRCRITVALIPRGEVMVEDIDHDPFVLASRVAKRIRRAVRRLLERRRVYA